MENTFRCKIQKGLISSLSPIEECDVTITKKGNKFFFDVTFLSDHKTKKRLLKAKKTPTVEKEKGCTVLRVSDTQKNDWRFLEDFDHGAAWVNFVACFRENKSFKIPEGKKSAINSTMCERWVQDIRNNNTYSATQFKKPTPYDNTQSLPLVRKSNDIEKKQQPTHVLVKSSTSPYNNTNNKMVQAQFKPSPVSFIDDDIDNYQLETENEKPNNSSRGGQTSKSQVHKLSSEKSQITPNFNNRFGSWNNNNNYVNSYSNVNRSINSSLYSNNNKNSTYGSNNNRLSSNSNSSDKSKLSNNTTAVPDTEVMGHGSQKKSYESGLLNCFVDTINQFCVQNNTKAIDIVTLRRYVFRSCRAFANRLQHDTHEFLTEFLNLIECELVPHLKTRKITYPNDAYLQCPSKRNFAFVLTKSFICQNCKKTTIINELFQDLSLEMLQPSKISELKKLHLGEKSPLSSSDKEWIKNICSPLKVNQLLRLYLLPELIERDCRCGHTLTVIEKAFLHLPRVLILHIKRFTLNEGENIYKKGVEEIFIDGDINLDITMLIRIGIYCKKNSTNEKNDTENNSDNESKDDTEIGINDSSKKKRCYSPIPCDMGEVMNSSIEFLHTATTTDEVERDIRSMTDEEQLNLAIKMSTESYENFANNNSFEDEEGDYKEKNNATSGENKNENSDNNNKKRNFDQLGIEENGSNKKISRSPSDNQININIESDSDNENIHNIDDKNKKNIDLTFDDSTSWEEGVKDNDNDKKSSNNNSSDNNKNSSNNSKNQNKTKNNTISLSDDDIELSLDKVESISDDGEDKGTKMKLNSDCNDNEDKNNKNNNSNNNNNNNNNNKNNNNDSVKHTEKNRDINIDEDFMKELNNIGLKPEENFKYSLTCIINHHGETASSGHYVVYNQHPLTQNWQYYNDSQVNSV